MLMIILLVGHVVGIMRSGRILTEGSPSTLTVKYGKKTLEDVFLHLCQMTNESEETADTDMICIDSNNNNNKSTEEFEPVLQPFEEKSLVQNNLDFSSSNNVFRNIILNLWILNVLIRKNLSRFFQFNISFLIFIIPAFQVWILCAMYNRTSFPVSK